MRFAIVGAGAVGGYFGACLARAGHEVGFLSRGGSLEALRAHGLTIHSVNGDFQISPVTAEDDPRKLGPVDVVIVAVKAWQVVEVAPTLVPLVGPVTMVLPLQNGVEAAQQLSAALSAKCVVGGLCRILSERESPGVIHHRGAEPTISLGELDNRATPRLTALARALAVPGITVEVAPNIQVALWEKFLFIASFGGVGAAARAPIGVLRSVPETRSLLERAMREVAKLAEARGVVLPKDTVARSMGYVDALPAEGASSLQRDILEGRPSEIESLSGAVVRLGAEARIATPVHAFLASVLTPQEGRARGKWALDG